MSVIRYTFFIIVFFSFVGGVNAQVESYSQITHSAIEDELERCMDSLKGDDCEPFFMGFGMSQNRSFSVLSTLGGIVFSGSSSDLDFSSRLMIGDYHFNDENFKSRSSDENFDDLAIPQMMLPQNPEYYPIRLALWGSAEKVYRSACKTYKDKMNTLINNSKTLDDYPLDDFSKSDVVVSINDSSNVASIDKNKLETFAKELSIIFKDYPKIINSVIYIGDYSSNYYFHNTEGTKIQFPLNLISIYVSAVTREEGASSASSSISFIGLSDSDLPSLDSMKQATRNFANKLVGALDYPVIEEEYSGPVLYEGNAASELFQEALFRSGKFVARREPMSDNRRAFYLPDDMSANSFERKLGKLVVDKSLTILSLPKAKIYNGSNLIGSYNVDAEGVVPPDTLVLVKNGKLQNLFNDRVPTFSFSKSNGHKRVYISRNGTRSAMGLGVVKITSDAGLSKVELKSKLLDRLKEEDLDYGYIIRKGFAECPFYMVYRVNAKNGEETPIRYFNLPQANLEDLKEDALFSDTEMLNNCIYGKSGMLSHQDGKQPNYGGNNGLPISIISPDAVLIDKQKLLVRTERDNYKSPIVPTPLGIK